MFQLHLLRTSAHKEVRIPWLKSAEKAKELWPRLDVQPAERSVLFETYDEREEYMRLARKRLGNAQIEKPEDFTYWLSTSE